jgi:nucleoside-diphosphate-sugar epimerase
VNVLITGITGFVGSHMAEFCLDDEVMEDLLNE